MKETLWTDLLALKKKKITVDFIYVYCIIFNWSLIVCCKYEWTDRSLDVRIRIYSLRGCVDSGVGGFLPAVKQIANVAALPGIVGVRTCRERSHTSFRCRIL